jgi:hypothetical protein
MLYINEFFRDRKGEGERGGKVRVDVVEDVKGDTLLISSSKRLNGEVSSKQTNSDRTTD